MCNLVKSILIICILICYHNIYGLDTTVNENQELSTAPYVACTSFNTERVRFERIVSAQQEIECYNAIYADSGFRNSWFTDVGDIHLWDKSVLDGLNEEDIATIKKDYGPELILTDDHDLIKKHDIEYFQKKERYGAYKLLMSFADYNLYDNQTQELVGRFILKNCEKNKRIEHGIYLLEKFRKNGLGLEVIAGIFKHVIDPAVGKSFVISYFHGCEVDHFQSGNFKTENYSNFQGVFGKISPWYNYPSLAISLKAGCALRWKDHTPITFYPIGNESHMSQSDIGYFNKVIETFFTTSEVFKCISRQKKEEEMRLIPSKQFFSSFNQAEEDSFEEYSKDEIIENLYHLLNTEDYDTFISTVEALIYMGESRESLREELSPEKVRNLLSKNENFLLTEHKDLLEYLGSESSEEDISQISKKRPLPTSDIKTNDTMPTKRSKKEK